MIEFENLYNSNKNFLKDLEEAAKKSVELAQ